MPRAARAKREKVELAGVAGPARTALVVATGMHREAVEEAVRSVANDWRRPGEFTTEQLEERAGLPYITLWQFLGPRTEPGGPRRSLGSPRSAGRSAFIGFQITPEERAQIEAGAAAEGISVSEYGRRRILNGALEATDRARVTAVLDELGEGWRQFAAVGNNLNQLSRHCNTTGVLEPPELVQVIGVIEEVARKLEAAFGHVLAL